MMEKEPFYASVRWWMMVLAAPVSLALALVLPHLPFVAGLPAEELQSAVTATVASWMVAVVTYVIGRTFRNTAVK